MAQIKRKSNSIRQQFEQLEKIVAEFEEGHLDVEDGLEKFEQGLQMATALKKQLSSVEVKIEQMKRKYQSVLENGEVEGI